MIGAKFKAEASKDSVFKLHFEDVSEMDEGDYTCEAYNVVGHAQTTSHIRVGSE